MKEGLEMLIVFDDVVVIEVVYDVKLEDGCVWLDGVLSCKK